MSLDFIDMYNDSVKLVIISGTCVNRDGLNSFNYSSETEEERLVDRETDQ